MSYEIIVAEEVEEKLNGKYRDRQEEFAGQIGKLNDFPDRYGKPLSGKLHGVWQLKFGKGDRIWYRIDDEENKVYVINLLSKKEAERRY